MKNPRGREIVLDLAKGADVFMQNFRPGVVDRLGVGEADVRRAAPNIIYTSISGFGDVGPWVGKPVYDPVIQAVSGLTTRAGRIRPGKAAPDPHRAARQARRRHGRAVHLGGAGSKARTGRGPARADLDARLGADFLWASDMGAQTFPDTPLTNQEAASFIDLIYETKDGYMTVAVMSNKEWIGLTKALERPEWLADERFATPAPATSTSTSAC